MSKLLTSSLMGIFESHEISPEEVERLKRSDALEEALKELSQHLPEVGETLVDERDQYLAAKIYSAPGQRVVAVVGAGHVQGIARYLGSICDIEHLEEVPPPSPLSRALSWLIPLAILAALIYGFLHWGQSIGLRMLGTWALMTALAGGLGCLLALAHPFTTLSGFLFAPIGALHPLIATGWITGLVEAGLRKPRVSDFESLSEQSLSLQLMYQNRVTRILLVALLTNLCVGLGNLLGGAMMFRAVSG
jgi:pheromone shutdown-related protein TraB